MSTNVVKVLSQSTDFDEQGNKYLPAIPLPRRTSGSDEIILPRWIYIQDREGRYLTVRSGPPEALLTFRYGAPDLDCVIETERQSADKFHLIAANGNHFMCYVKSSAAEYWYSTDPVTSEKFVIFHFILSRGNIVYLKDNITNSQRVMSNQLTSRGAPLARNFINEDSEMKISIAAVKKDIIDVQYDIPGGVVRDAAPRIALTALVRNDSSSSDTTRTLEYSYERWKVGT